MKADGSFLRVSERVSLPSLQGPQAQALALPEPCGCSPLLSEVRRGKENNTLVTRRGRSACLGHCTQLQACPHPPWRQESSWWRREKQEVDAGAGGVERGFWPKEKGD